MLSPPQPSKRHLYSRTHTLYGGKWATVRRTLTTILPHLHFKGGLLYSILVPVPLRYNRLRMSCRQTCFVFTVYRAAQCMPSIPVQYLHTYLVICIRYLKYYQAKLGNGATVKHVTANIKSKSLPFTQQRGRKNHKHLFKFQNNYSWFNYR